MATVSATHHLFLPGSLSNSSNLENLVKDSLDIYRTTIHYVQTISYQLNSMEHTVIFIFLHATSHLCSLARLHYYMYALNVAQFYSTKCFTCVTYSNMQLL